MGDAENTLPTSKKRAAGRELSRDNPGLDDEEEVPGQETGTFKRASEEVLANRRILKVRRNQPSSAPSLPSSNPFAAICLVPPTESQSNVKEVEKIASNEVERESQNNVNKETESKVEETKMVPNADEEKNEGAIEVRKQESTDTEVAKGKEIEEKEKTENEAIRETEITGVENLEKDSEQASVSSFQQLSSSQNAFTGLAGTGFSNSTFSFGSITKNDQPNFPSFSFGTNGNSSLFSNEKTEGSKIPTKVAVETGEENEKVIFTADSILFEFLDGGWKERGKGEVKVNVSTTGTGKARLVMRARGNYRLILNASLFPDMKLTNMEKKGITFSCFNSAGEGKVGLSTFALKFKDASFVEEFRDVVTQHKGNASAAPTLKTPENSPKSSDE